MSELPIKIMTPEEVAKQAAYEAAMQIVHGLMANHPAPLPTVEQVAEIILKQTDLVWLHAIRRRSELVMGRVFPVSKP